MLNIKTSISLALERTGTEPFNIENMCKDINSEFTDIKDEDITLAIRNGSLGAYGYTYKLTTQVVCIWVRKYLEDIQEEKNKMIRQFQ